MPSFSRRARMNLSMGLTARPATLIDGTGGRGGREGGENGAVGGGGQWSGGAAGGGGGGEFGSPISDPGGDTGGKQNLCGGGCGLLGAGRSPAGVCAPPLNDHTGRAYQNS